MAEKGAPAVGRRRRDRAAEIIRIRRDELGPELYAFDLELHQLYIIEVQGSGFATLQFTGKVSFAHPVMLDVQVTGYGFRGPNTGREIYLQAYPDGTLHEAGGTKVTLYQNSELAG